jgi:hypothetical protein
MKNYYNLLFVILGPFVFWVFLRIFWLFTGADWSEPEIATGVSFFLGTWIGFFLCSDAEEKQRVK